MSKFFEIKELNKVYDDKSENISVLNNVNISLEANKLVALTGPSGSGKSTLIQLISLLDSPNGGYYSLFSENNLFNLSDNEKSEYRKKYISIVFQNYNLISDLTALENVALPGLYLGKKSTDCYIEAKKLLESFGLANRVNHNPNELSGGEQQRVAIARSLINKPRLILADEPTGSLDRKNSETVIELLSSFKNEETLIIFATHNKALVNKSDLELTLSNGTVNFA